MLKNNNRAIIDTLAKKTIKNNKKNFSILFFTIALSALMLFCVITIGITYLDLSRLQNTRLNGAQYDITIMNGFSNRQLNFLKNNNKVESVGIEAYAGFIKNTEFDETFGFTDEEVKTMLHDYEMDDRYDEVKEWYDGYRFGKADVYCPWDVVNYCNDHIHNPEAEPENYWMNTSGNSVIHHFIDSINEPDMLTKTELEWLINGKTVIKPIDEMVTYNDLYSTMDHLWSTLFMTGYLTQRGRESDGRYCLAIPNREIRNIITERILTLFQQEVKKDGKMAEQFCQALFDGKAAEVERLLNLYLQKTVSVRDTFVRKSLKENFYHGILLGILSYKNDWRVSSNRESGEGFSDIVIETGDAETGIVIEVKYTDEKKDLERDCRKALEQIRDKDYTQTLWQDGYKKIVQYGISFHLKQCCVMEEEMQRKRNRDGDLNSYNLL